MIITKEIDYHHGETLCKGFIAYDETWESPMPAVMVAPDWGGRGEDACSKAIQLAKMGYVGFAVDMYGNAKLGHDNVERRALMTPLLQDRKTLSERIGAAFELLTRLPQVHHKKIAALGYCFGGLCVLDLARSGVHIQGVVSFHGLLTAPDGMLHSPIPAKILVLHGYDDPLVKPNQVEAFAKEMTQRQVDWQVHLYGLTAHSFTNPKANDPEMGLHYNQRADQRSWQTTELFLREVFS